MVIDYINIQCLWIQEVMSSYISITMFIIGDVRFSDILQNENSFHNYLTSSLHLNNSVADAIISSTINTQAVSILILSL